MKLVFGYWKLFNSVILLQGGKQRTLGAGRVRSQDFSKGEKGVTLCQSEVRVLCRFRHLLWVVCLKRGVTGTTGPLPTPLRLQNTVLESNRVTNK